LEKTINIVYRPFKHYKLVWSRYTDISECRVAARIAWSYDHL